ncbi:MAG: M15 family metallopeptidase [Cyanobacteria bacterium P01_D01_bin.105]
MSHEMSHEIPSAQRFISPNEHKTAFPNRGLPFIVKVAVIAVPIVVGGMTLALVVRSQVGDVPNTPVIDPAIDPPIASIPESRRQSAMGAGASSAATNSSSKVAYGHLPYSESDRTRLSSAGSFVRENYERAELLDIEAAQAFALMMQAAQAEGITLMPVSGFRSITAQKELFASQIDQKGNAEAAAQSSAPPGHSEHHTGYAIDITDADRPETDIQQAFEHTPAYQWLASNARMYGFEESFPKNNHQGVTFEPWHWRYVGSERAQKIFSDARRLYPSR